MPITEADLATDRELAEISGLLPMLRYTTPINFAEQYEKFLSSGLEPSFEYLPIPDLSEVTDRLSEVDPEQTSDPMIGQIARVKKHELEMVIELILARNSDGFFLAAVEFFGHVEPQLVDLASEILRQPVPAAIAEDSVGAAEFAQAAKEEVNTYRKIYPEMTARVLVSEITTGIRVENGDLYIGSDMRIRTSRIEPLLQHEVGVHMLTFANGSAQPLHLLAAGLPGYEENQEALGVLAEYLTGGLEARRLRVLALRVMASDLRSRDSSFMETFNELRRLGATRGVAFTTTMRSHRSGGMTRDAGYLRGFSRLLDHIAAGGNVDHLLVGKVRLEDEPIIKDLLAREVLGPPPLVPRFMQTERGQSLLGGLRRGIDILKIGRS